MLSERVKCTEPTISGVAACSKVSIPGHSRPTGGGLHRIRENVRTGTLNRKRIAWLTGYLVLRVEVLKVSVSEPNRMQKWSEEARRGATEERRETDWSVPLRAPYFASPMYCMSRHHCLRPERRMCRM